MIEQKVEVRLSGMVSACTYMNVGEIFNINKIQDGMAWCYCRMDLFGDHPGVIKLISPTHIQIFPRGIVVDGELGESTIHLLKYSPKLAHSNLYCFSFSPEETEFYTAEVARDKFLSLLCMTPISRKILNRSFPIGSSVEENVRLADLVKYKSPKCPQCGGVLYKVCRGSGSYLNDEQFESCRAGDYYCDKCPSNGRGNTDACYWWNRELDRGLFLDCVNNG